jgi:hypothetical protein
MSRSRQPACPERRDVLVAVAAGESKRDLALEAHLLACSGCRGFLAGVEAQMRAFRDLERRRTPRELDGLVVAATQAGHRQDRAVRALRSIGSTPMPAEIDRAIWPAGAEAPPVLDRLVERNLQDPTHTIARRFAGRIERLQAPRALEARVTRLSAFGRKRRDPFARQVALVAAALVLAVLTLTATWFIAKQSDVTAAEPLFVIERVNSVEEFDPFVQGTLAGLLGGVPDVERIQKGKL